ncbi:MAG: ABC transporter substrate-binding protein, partial [Chloroflexi bacterium]|nr:ABC transporter substrate-binding protein [Chloroflexota bacterium]
KPESVFHVYDSSVYGTSYDKAMKAWADGNKYKYQAESFEAGGVDFKPTLTKVKAANPDIVVYSAYLADAVLLVRQAKELELKPKIFAGTGGGFLYDEFGDGVKDLSTGLVAATISAPDLNFPGNKEFYASLKAKTGKMATFSQVCAYSSVFVLQDVLKRAKSLGRDDIRDAMAATDLMTAFGKIKFENWEKYTNQNHSPSLVVQWQNGKLATVYPDDIASAKLLFPVPGLR